MAALKTSLLTGQLNKKSYFHLQDPSERQVKVLVLDIDDNKPVFMKDNITLGKSYRVNCALIVAHWHKFFDSFLMCEE